MNKRLHLVYRDPFALGTPHIQVAQELTPISRLVSQASYLPQGFAQRGVVAVDGEVVPRELWASVRPKSGRVVTLHLPVQGGGGGKQVFALIAAIALSVATAGIAAGALAPLLGASFAAGTLGASLLAAGVGVVGSLAVSALSSPPVVKPNEDNASSGRRLEPASVSGNLLEPNTPVPRVIGVRRVFPPFLAEPYIELIGQNEVVHALYGLSGPHDLSEPRLGDASVEDTSTATDLTDVELELRDGTPEALPVSLVTRQGRTLEPRVELSSHVTDPENGDILDNATDNPLPVFHAVTTRTAPNENWMQLLLQGLTQQDAPDDSLRIPVRVRMRRRGDTEWRNLPEVHIQNATQSPVKLQFKFYWSAQAEAIPTPPATIGFTYARKSVPAQDVSPLGEIYLADSYFSAGSGNDVLSNTTVGTTNVQNIALLPESVEVYLDPASWPSGVYDIEIKRGATIQDSAFNETTYVYSGDILDLFGRIDSGFMPFSREGLLDRLVLIRLVNIWNEDPLRQANMAVIALRASNRDAGTLSVIASGIVHDQAIGRGPFLIQSSGGPTLWSWDKIETADDIELLALMRPTVVTDTDSPESLKILVRGSTAGVGSENGYTLGLGYDVMGEGSKDRLVLQKIVNGSVSVVADTLFNWDTDRNYFLRLSAVGTALKAKAWPAVLPEPEGWLIETTDSSISAAGWAGVFGYTALERGYFNWFAAALGSDTAASPPELTPVLATDFSEYPLNADPSDWTSRFSEASTFEVGESDKLPYNGNSTEWTTLRATSNPAPHFRDVLVGSLNFDPLPLDILDEAGLTSWRRRCAESDFTCDMVVEGLEIADLLRVVGSCGYARLYRSEQWGVSQDRSRRLETPVQIFSPRNSAGLSWRKAFVRLPAGFRVNFRDSSEEYGSDQIIIYRAASEGSGARLEQVTFDGIVSRRDVEFRARFDLLQAQKRATFYTFNAPAESIVCRRGSLIGMNSDILTRQYGYARVADTIVDEGYVQGVVLDAPVEVQNTPDVLNTADLLEVEDVLDLGLRSGLAIRKTSGQTSVHLVSSNTETEFTDTIMFDTPVYNAARAGSPFDPPTISEISPGCLSVIGLTGKEYRRMIVSEVVPTPNLEAQLVCVDEASDLFDLVFGATNDG